MCVLEYGINYYYRLIPPAEDLEDSGVVVEFSYILRNTRPAPQTVEKLMWAFNGNDKDMIGYLGSTLLDPVENVTVAETV